VEHVGHGLKTAAGVVRSAFRLSGPVLDRAHLIQEQKGIEVRELGRRKRAPDGKAGSLERVEAGDDARDGSRDHDRVLGSQFKVFSCVFSVLSSHFWQSSYPALVILSEAKNLLSSLLCEA